jgi:hypothetical protein
MSRQCPFYPESGLCWRRSPDTLVATHLGLARSRYRSPIYFRSPGLPSTLCSRGLFFQCAIAGATHHKPGLRCLAVAFRQAACSTRVSISLRSIPKSIGLVKFGLPLLHHAMRRTLAGNGQAIERGRRNRKYQSSPALRRDLRKRSCRPLSSPGDPAHPWRRATPPPRAGRVRRGAAQEPGVRS